MEKQFEFADFIEGFKVTFSAIPKTAGSFAANGKWQPGQDGAAIPMEGVILPLSNDDMKMVSNGVYTEKDRKVYLTQPLEIGQKIEYKGVTYTVESEKAYSDYADVYIYFCKGADR